MAPPGELRVNAGVVWLAGNTVWSTPERIRGEVLTTMRYTNLRLPIEGTGGIATKLHSCPQTNLFDNFFTSFATNVPSECHKLGYKPKYFHLCFKKNGGTACYCGGYWLVQYTLTSN